MQNKKINPRFGVLLLFILAVGIIRVFNSGQLTPLSNFTPIGAMALFGGAYFTDKWKAYFFPLLTLFLSDVVINLAIYKMDGVLYSGWYYNYLAFALMVLIGQAIHKVTIFKFILGAVGAALIHWIVSDFGVWIGGGTNIITGQPFTKDLNGYLECLDLAIPFMQRMLMGNLVYGGLMFGSFELLKQKYPQLAIAR
ncbi:hypothetical protein LX64_00146 [Chitinophaga skermanii]|uniref:Uncharacterized protein n=1 Tax=Chitinophaga skermanii TaxID=331697 RepID=A0A327R487_9BACT|nr:DUF6580 family putative transport protein [Chitinophaga skermanii]RAJ10543.1 hypothetical protein LX64_00146 [Chitinophaga skermanii]